MKLFKVLIILSLVLLSACSYFFPDKEKDYIYSQRIAALEMPPNLKTAPPINASDTLTSATLSHTIEFIKQESETHLLIHSTFAHVWRVVGKALTERSIEITDKNRTLATYYVQYDPNVKETEKDGSYWDEMVFFFGSDPHQEKPYQVFLRPSTQGTQIFVRNEQGHNLSQGEGLQLLKTLFETIKKDFEK